MLRKKSATHFCCLGYAEYEFKVIRFRHLLFFFFNCVPLMGCLGNKKKKKKKAHGLL